MGLTGIRQGMKNGALHPGSTPGRSIDMSEIQYVLSIFFLGILAGMAIMRSVYYWIEDNNE